LGSLDLQLPSMKKRIESLKLCWRGLH